MKRFFVVYANRMVNFSILSRAVGASLLRRSRRG